MLTAQELITLIKAHNKLVSIKVRASMKRETLIKLIEDKGYKVDHKNKKIVDARKDRPRRPKITLKEAEDMLPKPKTALQKQKAQERKEEKAAEEKKKLRMAKKEAVEQSKKGTKKPAKKPMKKEDVVRPKEKVGRPRVDPKKIKVIEPKKEDKLYEKEYNEFLKMFNEAKERRSRTPFLKLRERIMRFTEPILVGTASSKVQDGARLKALKEPFMKKIQDILDKVDTQIKKYVDIGKKTTGGQQTRPKKEIKISNKPTLNTKR